MPSLKLTRQINELTARMEYAQGMGPDAIEALERTRYRRAAALVMQQTGRGYLVGEDQEAGVWARTRFNLFPPSEATAAAREFGETLAPEERKHYESLTLIEQLVRGLDTLNRSIDQANSAGTFSRTGTGE